MQQLDDDQTVGFVTSTARMILASGVETGRTRQGLPVRDLRLHLIELLRHEAERVFTEE